LLGKFDDDAGACAVSVMLLTSELIAFENEGWRRRMDEDPLLGHALAAMGELSQNSQSVNTAFLSLIKRKFLMNALAYWKPVQQTKKKDVCIFIAHDIHTCITNIQWKT
jgi:hypothetical protein